MQIFDIGNWRLVWQSREIENCLISDTALRNYDNAIEDIKQCKNFRIEDLKSEFSGDGSSVQNWDIKSVIWPIIHNEDNSLNVEELDRFVSLMHPDEISVDIPNMFEYICEKLKQCKSMEKSKDGKAGKSN